MVKSLFKFAMILMASVPLTMLSACSNGDDDEDTDTVQNVTSRDSELVGVWADYDDIEYGFDECCAIQFNANGTGSDGTWDTIKKKFKADGDTFTWFTMTAGRAILDYGDYDIWAPNYVITGKTLYMWEDDEEFGHDVLKKVK